MQGLPLGEGQRLDFRRFPHLAAQQVERAAEGDARAGAGLEKHAGKDRAFENARDARSARVRFHLVRNVEQAFDIVTFELIDGKYVLADEVQGSPLEPKAYFLGRRLSSRERMKRAAYYSFRNRTLPAKSRLPICTPRMRSMS